MAFLLIIFIPAILLILYRKFRLLKPDPELVKSFLRGGLSDKSPGLIAHRGGSAEAPENTLAAFRSAKENGAIGVEFDVYFTKDSRAVVIHDATVDRTTNGSGPISSFTLEEIRKLDASVKHPLREKFPGEKVPTLEEVVELCSSLGLKMIIEIKKGTETLETAQYLKNLFSSYHLYDKALVCCYFPSVIYQVRKVDPQIVTALVWWRDTLSYILTGGKELFEIKSSIKVSVLSFFDRLWESLLPWFLDFVGVPILSCAKEHVCKDMLEMWSEQGIQVVAWTVNHKEAKEFFRDCLDCPIITDCVLSESVWNEQM